MAYFRSLREYVQELDRTGHLVKVTVPVNKDTVLVPMVKLQERSTLPEEKYQLYLFTNVFDSRGRKYSMPVLYGPHDLSTGFSAIGLKCPEKEVSKRVAEAIKHPLKPKMVKNAPVQEEVHMGKGLLEKGGMDEIPVPITHPGFDAGPIMSSSNWVTKDPDTGIRNVGVYRSHVYAPGRVGIHTSPNQDLQVHFQKCRARGIPLQAAIVIGGPPNLTWSGAYKVDYGVDEYGVAGAMVGEPVELVKCKTVDLEVPANADIVIEGELGTEWLELEGPHGEGGSGEHMAMGDEQPFMTIKCITHRKDAMWYGPASGGPRGSFLELLRDDYKMKHVLAVGSPPRTSPGSTGIMAIKMKNKTRQDVVWKTLETVAEIRGGKFIIAVDEDIDIHDYDSLFWALAWRSEPYRDYRTVEKAVTHFTGVSYLPEKEYRKIRDNQFDSDLKFPKTSSILMNATLKWAYPPVSLPAKKFMQEAIALRKELRLPTLQMREPWYGYEYEYSAWTDEYRRDAERAVKGEYYKTSEERSKKRKRIKGSTADPMHGHPGHTA